MIFGIGCDLVDIHRIAHAMENRRFLVRNFSQAENEYFSKRQFSPAVVAANFAGKEAFAKALGTGVSGFALHEVEVLRNKAGKPYLRLTGDALSLAESLGIECLHISLTHTDASAGAFVVAEAQEKGEI